MQQKIKNVLIGIQARSTSERLPRKVFEKIGSKRLLDHVIDACQSAASYSNRFTNKKNFSVQVAVLCPDQDPIEQAFRGQCEVMTGPELDVLSRYYYAATKVGADYVCRITGDCPLIPPYVISKHISIAIVGGYDYVSNVDEACRLSLDGIDCEVLSMSMLEWLFEHARDPYDREHVTTLARKAPPEWAAKAFTASYFNNSGIKLSVDTKEDLERVRKEYDAVGKALIAAEKIYGRQCIHRF